ncbi:ArsR/SmtB family transcription factor [Fretibacter rubidus]|uniref:ArsR/SmtB family transcription factor n=1 Tax=Fretibacter rubidus TaxID=570162 RepID=UPI00352BA40D
MSPTRPLPDICQQHLAAAFQPDMFKALCDPVRVSIIADLATRKDPVPVSAIAQCCGIDFSGVSRHLKILREAGLVSATKDGRSVLYQLRTEHMAQTLQGLADALRLCQKSAHEDVSS